MTSYQTSLSHITLPAFVPLSPGRLITVVPLGDSATGGFAHLSYARALEAAQECKAELPTREDVLRLHEVGAVIPPVILPASSAMSTLVCCKAHDERVRDLLYTLPAYANGPICNAGKHWIQPCPPGRGRICGWFVNGKPIQAGTNENGQHGDQYFDYATTTMLVRAV